MRGSWEAIGVRLLRDGLVLALSLVIGLMAAGDVFGAEALRLDPEKVQGPDACGECHKASAELWKLTVHSTTFKTLQRSKEAKKIAREMGVKRIKRSSDCLFCHYTAAKVKNRVKAISGITCESCHGAGKDWSATHADYGGKTVTREMETPAHRKERYAKSVAAGLIRPSRIFDVASNCFGCHTVPNEKLVNVGGHPAGSKFELVAWSHGEMRHNVWYSKENAESPIQRRRMMTVVGHGLDLAFALRGVAKATKKAPYAVSMAKRASAAKAQLKKIVQLVPIPEIQKILAVAAKAKLKLNNKAALNQAAQEVENALKAFAESHDGSKLAALDSLLPAPDKYKGKLGKIN
jgi:hypothetical protein